MARKQAPQSPDVEPVSEVVQTPDETFADGAIPVDDDGNEIDLDDLDLDVDEPSPQQVANGEVTRTSNFFGGPDQGSQVQDRGIEVVEQKQDSSIVRVIEDVGPIFLGRRRQLAMQKGVAYKVDSDIREYLSSRNLILGE